LEFFIAVIATIDLKKSNKLLLMKPDNISIKESIAFIFFGYTNSISIFSKDIYFIFISE